MVLSSARANAPETAADPLSRNTEQLKAHFDRTLAYVFRNTNPETGLAYSQPGDERLTYWSVSYDNAIRILAHIQAGQIDRAKLAMDYFLTRSSIRHDGWVINIVDGAENRPAGRGVEHIRHVGPNVYLGIAAATLFGATGDKKYLEFARERWRLVASLQNKVEGDPNYGGVSMGPVGHGSPGDQRFGYQDGAPSWADLYNTEHNADFAGFSRIMSEADPNSKRIYLEARHLVSLWAKTVYNPKTHLFFMGKTTMAYHDILTDKWMEPGIQSLHPLDSTALMISAFGYNGLDAMGLDPKPGVAERIRNAIDENFKVTVVYTAPSGRGVSVTGYDFLSHSERKTIAAYEERGERGDVPVLTGFGRKALLSDEWSSWVAFADLALAQDLTDRGEPERAQAYIGRYRENALVQGLRTAVQTDDGLLAYPYAHPIPYSLNKPVGFGWNTHHKPYALIGGLCRYLAAVSFDPLRGGGAYAIKLPIKESALAPASAAAPDRMLFTEAEQYVTRAWKYVEEQEWQKAIDMIDRLNTEHEDWIYLAKKQEALAAETDDFPLRYLRVEVKDLEPVFKKYWALYHLGTGEYIRLKCYAELGKESEATAAVVRSLRDYPHAQAYDPNGWMWQMADSAAIEYEDLHKQAVRDIAAETARRKGLFASEGD